MPRHAFDTLLDVLRFDLNRNDAQEKCLSRGKVEHAARLAITLHMLAGATFIDLVTNHNFAPATVYEEFHDTILHILERLVMPGIRLRDFCALRRLAMGLQTSASEKEAIPTLQVRILRESTRVTEQCSSKTDI
eukprot:IDg11023t1